MRCFKGRPMGKPPVDLPAPKQTGNYCGKCCQKRISCGGRCNVCGSKLA